MLWTTQLFLAITTTLASFHVSAMPSDAQVQAQVMPQRVTFMNHYGVQLVGNLHHPPNFDPQASYAGIVTVGPAAGVKEQASGNYASRLADEGFVTIAFDNTFQGESGGFPRFQENPHTRVEDIHGAVDHLISIPYVNNTRIGVLGICAGGGYSANAAMIERRIKAVGLVVPVDGGRGQRAGGEDATITALEAIADLRSAEATGQEPTIMEWFSDSAANSTDIDTREGYDYYRTPRGGLTPSWQNKVRFSTMDAVMNYDSFYLADMLLTQPLQVVVGSIPGSYESNRHGHIIHDMAASTQKDIVVLEGASHFDLYDRPQYVEPAVARLAQFYKEQLA